MRKHHKSQDKRSDTFVYSINENDIITNYSKNFPSFARNNDWQLEMEPEAILGRSIFDFISGAETQHLYQILFEHCRKGKHIGPIPFRCDSPRERRFLELHLRLLPNSHIDIITVLLKTEHRPPVRILQANTPRTEEFIRICSMCKKIFVDDEWVEIEEALIRMKLFEQERLPYLTHGLCNSCYVAAISELQSGIVT